MSQMTGKVSEDRNDEHHPLLTGSMLTFDKELEKGQLRHFFKQSEVSDFHSKPFLVFSDTSGKQPISFDTSCLRQQQKGICRFSDV